MKKSFWAISFLGLFLTSCLDVKEPQYSPQISVSEFVAFHADEAQSSDTLKVRLENGDYVLDTIAVGDTVRYAVLINAVTNQLTTFSVKTDAGVLDLSLKLVSDHTEALDESSDSENGYLKFKVGYSAASIPMEYVALKSGSATVSMIVSSTSEFSPSSLSFKQPVR